MAYDIGPKIGIEGEAEYKKAIAGINKDLSVLGSEMKKVTAQFSGNADSMQALTAKQDVYNKQADEQRKKIELMTGALDKAKKEYGENSDQVKNWQIKLNNAEADLAKTENSLKQVTEQIDNYGKEADNTGKEVEKAGKKAKESGDDAQKGESGWSKLGNVMGDVAKAAGIAVAAIATAAAGAAAAVVKMAADAAKSGADYADNINTIAAQTGLSTDQIQQFQYQADMVDVSLETITGSMARLTKNMGTAQRGTGEAAKAFEALGISITDSNGELRNNQDVFNEAIDALGKMENETQRDAYAMQIFGKSARDLNPLILAGSDTLNQFAKDAKDSGYILSGEALTALNDYQDSLDKIARQKDALSNAIGVAAASAFKVFTDSADGALKSLTKLINGDIDAEEFADQIGEAVGSISDYITEALPKLMEAGTAILRALVDAISQNLPMLLNAATPVITTLISGITQMLPAVINAAIPILQALVDGVVQALPALVPAAVEMLMTLVQAIIDNLPLIIDASMQLIVSLAQGIADALPELIPAVIDAMLLIVDTLIDNIGMLVDASIEIIVALAQGLIDALPQLVERIPEIVVALVNALLENLPLLIEAALQIIFALAKGLIQAIPELIKAIPEIISALVKGFGKFASKMADIGLNLVKGLWQGIKDAAAWIKRKISGWVDDVVGSIKSFFGISSPSKLMAAIGKYLPMGLAEGILKNAHYALDAMTRLGDDMIGLMPTDISGPGISVSGGITRMNGGFAIGGAIVIQTPVLLDGRLISRSTSVHQSGRNKSYSRAVGVAV